MLTIASTLLRTPGYTAPLKRWPITSIISSITTPQQQQTPQTQQTRQMSKFLPKSATKRLPLTTKRARKGYYKGKGGTRQGSHTGKAGAYVMNKDLMLELMVPDLEGFKLKPYIASTIPKWAPEERR
mmetsp:Transcript_27083/g.31993  ORF Transcript_27083/g.31993 Transcript_27083/m.31993 type:complete len:127 (+) Transcript_27083:82-462(+)